MIIPSNTPNRIHNLLNGNKIFGFKYAIINVINDNTSNTKATERLRKIEIKDSCNYYKNDAKKYAKFTV